MYATAPLPQGLGPTPGPTGHLAQVPPSTAQVGKRIMGGQHATESPAKKQSKWSPEEDALIIELRGSGMKWEDISKRLLGRSAISCRLHYQNYLERRSEWDEERKNKLARLYERFKPEMWAKVAEEMAIPWRAAEAMHWQLGEQDMARRAGVVPFSLSSASVEPQSTHRNSPRVHGHSQSQGSIREVAPGRGHYSVGAPAPPGVMGQAAVGRPLVTRRESLPSQVPPPPLLHQVQPELGHPAPLAPIQPQGPPRPSMLPSVAELTTGVSPYSTPAHSMGVPSASPGPSATGSPGPHLPPTIGYSPMEPPGAKRRASPNFDSREANRRRHMDPRYEHYDRSVPRHMP